MLQLKLVVISGLVTRIHNGRRAFFPCPGSTATLTISRLDGIAPVLTVKDKHTFCAPPHPCPYALHMRKRLSRRRDIVVLDVLGRSFETELGERTLHPDAFSWHCSNGLSSVGRLRETWAAGRQRIHRVSVHFGRLVAVALSCDCIVM